ncbi:helix-turn-helix transcriptional regulator [Paenarthrobacter sp. NPDC090520]|uniref:helix-turn-helix transcriptional regulator n=1 Tax=Paenarthrobacter sp. NPDC090520 TaxID=3364382 RepID=UPI00380B8018
MEVALRLKNLDLTNEAVLEKIGDSFQDVMWSTTAGLTTATVYVDREDAANQVLAYVRRFEANFSGVKTLGVHRDLVGASDIALRTGLSREGVRKWAAARNFPAPFDVVGSKDSNLWIWSEVVRWLMDERGLNMDEDLPDVELMTQIDNCIMRNPDHTTMRWHQLAPKPVLAQRPLFQNVQPAVRISAGGHPQEVGREFYDLVAVAAPAYVH